MWFVTREDRKMWIIISTLCSSKFINDTLVEMELFFFCSLLFKYKMSTFLSLYNSLSLVCTFYSCYELKRDNNVFWLHRVKWWLVSAHNTAIGPMMLFLCNAGNQVLNLYECSAQISSAKHINFRYEYFLQNTFPRHKILARTSKNLKWQLSWTSGFQPH